MSLAVVHSRGLVGVEAPSVSVEVHLANGLPAFHVVGLPDAEVRESRERVRAALLHSGFDFPNRRITVNLAPADLPKGSGRFDLPIAIGILAAAAGTPAKTLESWELMGELSLTGALRPVRGALVLALAVRRHAPGRLLVLPAASAAEAVPAGHAGTRAASSLREVWAALAEGGPLAAPPSDPASDPGAPAAPVVDLADVRGQAGARRALEIAAAGGHGMLLVGPPGSGKSMLAQRLPGLLPPMTEDEALESAAVLSLAGTGWQPRAWGRRPFRAPHHSASGAALVGGGGMPRPGEISLAHRGVLFLDELAEFHRGVLETLREPLETGRVSISRAGRQAEFPAAFQLVAATNPCPCGWFGHARGRCRCAPADVARYRGRLSGPLLDRIDMHVEVPAVPQGELLAQPAGESTATVRARAAGAREIALARQGKSNAALVGPEVDAHCAVDAAGRALLATAIERLNLSARALPRLLKLARTIADLAGATGLAPAHVAEAIGYRRWG
ncbi:MAG: ATP-binding protein [Burkholderiales bacterium]|nr:MAG: ATP-binding protein [Burkholderiales bacterium]